MRLGLLIVICSVLASNLHAMRFALYSNGALSNGYTVAATATPSGSLTIPAFTGWSGGTSTWSGVRNLVTLRVTVSGVEYQFGAVGIFGDQEWLRIDVVPGGGVQNIVARRWSGDPRQGGQAVQTFYSNGYTPDETENFEWTFGPEWSGSVVEVREVDGTVLGSWVVPQGGGVIESSVTGNLNGAEVFIDGVSVSELAMTASGADLEDVADRPGYSFNFDASYNGHDWEIRRPDGSVAAGGSAGSFWQVQEGRITMPEGQQGTVWVRQNLGDGMGSVWVSSGVQVGGSGNSITYNNFNDNPNPVPDTPMPTPAPVTPAPLPTPAPTIAPRPTPTVVNPTNSEDYVDVDVGSVTLPSIDSGEQAALSQVGTIQGLMAGIVNDMAQVQINIQAAGAELNGLRLSGVGRNCVFSMGPATVTIQTSGPIRTGLTLLVIGMAGFAAASMIRNAVQ